MNDGDRLVGWLLSKRQPRERWGRRRGWWARSRALCNQCWRWQQLPGGKKLSKGILFQEQAKSSFGKVSWIPGHLDDALLPGAGLHHVQPEQLFQLVALQASVQGHLRFKQKGSSNDQLQYPVQCHLEVIFWIFGRNNKQTNLLPPLIQFLLSFHCGFTNSHWCCGVRMSTFLWAVFNLACCTSFTSQAVSTLGQNILCPVVTVGKI